MDTTFKTTVWSQFGAAIDMLENAVRACPESLWGDRRRQPEFWYVTYHTLFFLDYYLSDSAAGFAPPAPFTLAELDPTGVLPERVYTKGELQAYLEYGRQKLHRLLATATESTLASRCGFERPDLTVAELLLYTMRHVQHHAAQLNLLLRQAVDAAPRWVAKTALPGDNKGGDVRALPAG